MNTADEDIKFLKDMKIEPDLEAGPEPKENDAVFLEKVGVKPELKLSAISRLCWAREKIKDRIINDREGRKLAKEFFGDLASLAIIVAVLLGAFTYLAPLEWWRERTILDTASYAFATIFSLMFPGIIVWLKFSDVQFSYSKFKSFYCSSGGSAEEVPREKRRWWTENTSDS